MKRNLCYRFLLTALLPSVTISDIYWSHDKDLTATAHENESQSGTHGIFICVFPQTVDLEKYVDSMNVVQRP